MLTQSQEVHDDCANTERANVKHKSNTYYNSLKDIYGAEVFKNSDTNIDTVWLEQHGKDYIKPDADVQSRPPIRNENQLKCMYPGCFDGIGENKDF